MTDSPRLLHSRSEHGYTDSTFNAMNHEPEAVPEEYQTHLTAQARQAALTRRLETWQPHHDQLTALLNALADQLPDLKTDIQAIRRIQGRIDRSLRQGLP